MPITWLGPDVLVQPGGPVRGSVRPPGSKSLTNRYLVCAALADGRSTLRNVAPADDAELMIEGLRRLDLPVQGPGPDQAVVIDGCRGHLPAGEADINVGNAGTAMRFLTALTTLGYGEYRLDGSARMRQRPIGALVEALHELGAAIGYEGAPGFPPLTVMARGLRGGQVRMGAPESSQFVSALLMAAPYAADDVFIALDGPLPSEPYVDMTIAVMHALGVEVLAAENRRFVVAAGQRYQAGDFEIEPDASAATYLWAAAAVTGGAVRVLGLDRSSLQGDVGFVDVLAQMGCTVHDEAGPQTGDLPHAIGGLPHSQTEDLPHATGGLPHAQPGCLRHAQPGCLRHGTGDSPRATGGEPHAIEVQGPPAGGLRGIEVDLNAMPDTVQTLAVTALFARGPTDIRNVANLRVKETDRIAALAVELARLGARVEVRPDGLTIHPPPAIQPAEIETYDDHRMALSFAVAGLAAEGIVIRNAGCVSKSFPEYFEVLNQLA